MILKRIAMIICLLCISACTEAPSLVINFETNGAEEDLIKMIYDASTFELPADPTKEDYVFEGWYLDNQTFLTPFDETILSSTEESYITIYAKWTPITYEITLQTYENVTNEIFVNGGFQTVSLGEYHSAAITSQGDLWTWGNGDFGQLGHQANKPTNITQSFDLDEGESLKQVYLGWEHSAVLTSFHQLYTFGRNDGGQLGINATSNMQHPTNITNMFSLLSDEIITEVALGWGHSIALTSLGRLFTWGKNDSGQLGDGTNQPSLIPIDISSRIRLLSNDQIISIAAGSSHSAFLTKQGRVFMWGRNVFGQLGDGTKSNKNRPIEITSNFNTKPDEIIETVALGWGHSSALTSQGHLYTWGFNGFGQLGNQTLEDYKVPMNTTAFVQLESNEIITDVILGSSHSSIQTSSNRRFVWGWNQYGQLGFEHKENQSVPVEFQNPFESQIAHMSLGVYHSAILLNNGYLYTYGYNNKSQLGHSGMQQMSEPKPIELFKDLWQDTHMIESSAFPFMPPITKIEGLTFLGWFKDRASLNNPLTQINEKKDHMIFGIYVKDSMS